MTPNTVSIKTKGAHYRYYCDQVQAGLVWDIANRFAADPDGELQCGYGRGQPCWLSRRQYADVLDYAQQVDDH